MKAFFAGKYGAMLKTFLKAFLAAAIVQAAAMLKAGTFDLNAVTLQQVAVSGLVGLLMVAVTAVDPTDSRYGLGTATATE